MFATLFASLFVQGILLGLAALALLAAAPRLQKRYGPQWLCRLWVTLAVLLLVPLHALVPQAPAAVSVDTTPLYSAPPTVCPTWLPWRAARPRATSCPAPSCRRDTARCWNASPSAQRG